MLMLHACGMVSSFIWFLFSHQPVLCPPCQRATSASTGSAPTTAPPSTLCAASRTSWRAPWQPCCPTKPWPSAAPGAAPGAAPTTRARRLSELGRGGTQGDSRGTGGLPRWPRGRSHEPTVHPLTVGGSWIPTTAARCAGRHPMTVVIASLTSLTWQCLISSWVSASLQFFLTSQ